VGPYLPLDTHFAIGNFIHNLLRQEDIVVKGDGTPLRSYLYASDLAIWLWTILFKGVDNYPYNVGSEDAISIEDLANLIAEQDPSRNTHVLVYETKKNHPAHSYVPSIARAKNELKLLVNINITEAIRKTMAFYSKIT
jgi:dTDP-glucose 4,6-dehydratase